MPKEPTFDPKIPPPPQNLGSPSQALDLSGPRCRGCPSCRSTQKNPDKHGIKREVPLLGSDEFFGAHFHTVSQTRLVCHTSGTFRAFYRRSLVLVEVIFSCILSGCLTSAVASTTCWSHANHFPSNPQKNARKIRKMHLKFPDALRSPVLDCGVR